MRCGGGPVKRCAACRRTRTDNAWAEGTGPSARAFKAEKCSPPAISGIVGSESCSRARSARSRDTTRGAVDAFRTIVLLPKFAPNLVDTAPGSEPKRCSVKIAPNPVDVPPIWSVLCRHWQISGRRGAANSAGYRPTNAVATRRSGQVALERFRLRVRAQRHQAAARPVASAGGPMGAPGHR